MNFIRFSSLFQLILIGLLIIFQTMHVSLDTPRDILPVISVLLNLYLPPFLPVLLYYFTLKNYYSTQGITLFQQTLVTILIVLLFLLPSLFYIWYILGLLEFIPDWGDPLIGITLIIVPVALTITALVPAGLYTYLVSKHKAKK